MPNPYNVKDLLLGGTIPILSARDYCIYNKFIFQLSLSNTIKLCLKLFKKIFRFNKLTYLKNRK